MDAFAFFLRWRALKTICRHVSSRMQARHAIWVARTEGDFLMYASISLQACGAHAWHGAARSGELTFISMTPAAASIASSLSLALGFGLRAVT